jgi:hypothetical protein
MIPLLLRSYALLLRFEILLCSKNFAQVYEKIRVCRVAPARANQIASEAICRSIDLACVFYWKPVLCLQRSAATTCLLRRCGFPAVLLLGAKQLPFRAHAWVELNGLVVNDKPYVKDIYAVLDRC